MLNALHNFRVTVVRRVIGEHCGDGVHCVMQMVCCGSVRGWMLLNAARLVSVSYRQRPLLWYMVHCVALYVFPCSTVCEVWVHGVGAHQRQVRDKGRMIGERLQLYHVKCSAPCTRKALSVVRLQSCVCAMHWVLTQQAGHALQPVASCPCCSS
jgi:hypothetical protein